MLVYGEALTIARTKNVFMVAVLLFEIGSLVCAVATNVNVLIFGRAFAG
jgi:predicted MFS family arabinose efflux permease